MTTQISGDTGVSAVQPNVVSTTVSPGAGQGSCTKFADGSMVQYAQLPTGSIAAQTVGYVTWAFPVPFVGDYGLTATPLSTAPQVTAHSAEKISQSTGRCYVFNGNSSTPADVAISFIAVGRWK